MVLIRLGYRRNQMVPLRQENSDGFYATLPFDNVSAGHFKSFF
ncbi:hypothetical protein ADIS_0892 [Lunatimonas lonarensis]|uniref:Uncharacterized protein n=1 Tax=Lunatimonas lonarensis TaxID=1232681 RepID=R7ZWT4_9BACT|nr:hypothetical protein ADIS_0892 [Lunatimonas lonarensis]